MGTIDKVRSNLCEILLVACDQSYKAAIAPGTPLAPFPDSQPTPGTDILPNSMPQGWQSLQLSDWQVEQRFDYPNTGFGATIYQKTNSDGSFDYIVALQGTRGPNIQDWGGNLIYGWDKWSSPEVQGTNPDGPNANFLAHLLSLPDVNEIHFIGQSLGGALAQYALYDYASQNPDFDSSKVTLTTFNGLSSIEALQKNRTGFDSSFVANVDTAHFHTTNDVVHRLGGGNLNGAGNEYLLDFTRTDVIGNMVRRLNGTPVALNGVDAHRIESGFYYGFNQAEFRYQLDPGLFDEMRDGTKQGLIIGSDRFKSEIKAMLKRKVELAKCGRLVKSRDNQRKGEQLLLAERK